MAQPAASSRRAGSGVCSHSVSCTNHFTESITSVPACHIRSCLNTWKNCSRKSRVNACPIQVIATPCPIFCVPSPIHASDRNGVRLSRLASRSLLFAPRDDSAERRPCPWRVTNLMYEDEYYENRRGPARCGNLCLLSGSARTGNRDRNHHPWRFY